MKLISRVCTLFAHPVGWRTEGRSQCISNRSHPTRCPKYRIFNVGNRAPRSYSFFRQSSTCAQTNKQTKNSQAKLWHHTPQVNFTQIGLVELTNQEKPELMLFPLNISKTKCFFLWGHMFLVFYVQEHAFVYREKMKVKNQPPHQDGHTTFCRCKKMIWNV